MQELRIVGISGNVKAPSRTSALVASVLRRIESELGLPARHIDLAVSAPALFRALRADQLDEEGAEIVRAVENADVLVVGSPVYRASYSGALKHLFDLVHYESLIGKPVILAATGGTPLHGLMIDHQLRPLFSFFKALSLPTSVYALESEFDAYAVAGSDIQKRIRAAVRELELIVPHARTLALARAEEQSRLRA
ncbi:FMN reductase [Rhizobium sp. Pop5]|uniref:FMN reductase n=1 Tax=Rhizobium sp. Pop5 TaxID=1223565 RepID=UPI000283BAA5|nr:FMN reductase [Rhizobium sp. Pop5]EJZ22521.1 NADH-dependent FMN reductase [Rhizobium sp. Pop5]UVD57304.1 FMN reductase [Rhizobium sp. Pop5]